MMANPFLWMSFFPMGKPARNVKVEVYSSDETLYLSGKTDAEGKFSFDSGDEVHLKVVAIGKLGHRAEQEVYLGEATPEESERSEGAAPTEEKVRQREPIPLREIFAGFGYILGVAGILMYLKARSDLRKNDVSSGDRQVR
jgi:nickel transport protein